MGDLKIQGSLKMMGLILQGPWYNKVTLRFLIAKV